MTKPTCQYCGAGMHDGTCPRIKRIEYGPSAIAGGPPIIMAVEFHPFTVEFTNEDATMLLSGSMDEVMLQEGVINGSRGESH